LDDTLRFWGSPGVALEVLTLAPIVSKKGCYAPWCKNTFGTIKFGASTVPLDEHYQRQGVNMGFPKTHSFQDKSSHTSQPMTQFGVRPFEAPVQLRSLEQPTPEEQERLGGGESGDGGFLGTEKGTGKRFGHNFANISVNSPGEQDAPQLQPMWRDGTPGVPKEGQRSLFNFEQQSSALPLQAKLTIGQPEDQYEQEADRVATQVVEQIHAPAIAQSNQGQSVQRQEEKPEGLQTKPILQRREVSAGGEASTELESAINNEKGSGQPIEASLQESMGQAMGADFSQVRVHTDAQSDQLNQ
jgi:hypothetical protein